ncbi:zinc-dependent alcohol dehydrogenase family protein [Chitinolyticbacter meiyuanensis]|uniref:zinc-dependent alcohol dehydrogenase family protein n=1 Tax=Chitinolyticbacter meiyuanensis TaxID=682798 RepID=UPI0011E59E92|nr:NAD(P)-dependent alcohol dehydrogenase [Chitinolyticbacter meiyuanensis]
MTTTQQWQMHGYGEQQLELVTTTLPEPGPGEVLVKVAAAALNYRDLLMIEHGMGLPLAFPQVPGSDMAGTVLAIGPGVNRVRVGQRVISTFWGDWHDGLVPPRDTWGTSLGGPLTGTLSQHVVIKADHLVAAPDTLDDPAASTLTCAGLTAWFALVDHGGIKGGDTVVVQGTGGVALWAAQIALAHGATVIATSGSTEKLARLAALGVQHGIDRHAHPEWSQQVRELTVGRGADHVLELVGGSNIQQSLAALRQGGRLSVIGVLDGPDLAFSAVQLLLRRPTIQGIGVGPRSALERLAAFVDQHRLQPVIAAEFGYRELSRALAALRAGPFGKVVVRFDQ